MIDGEWRGGRIRHGQRTVFPKTKTQFPACMKGKRVKIFENVLGPATATSMFVDEDGNPDYAAMKEILDKSVQISAEQYRELMRMGAINLTRHHGGSSFWRLAFTR